MSSLSDKQSYMNSTKVLPVGREHSLLKMLDYLKNNSVQVFRMAHEKNKG